MLSGKDSRDPDWTPAGTPQFVGHLALLLSFTFHEDAIVRVLKRGKAKVASYTERKKVCGRK